MKDNPMIPPCFCTQDFLDPMYSNYHRLTQETTPTYTDTMKTIYKHTVISYNNSPNVNIYLNDSKEELMVGYQEWKESARKDMSTTPEAYYQRQLDKRHDGSYIYAPDILEQFNIIEEIPTLQVNSPQELTFLAHHARDFDTIKARTDKQLLKYSALLKMVIDDETSTPEEVEYCKKTRAEVKAEYVSRPGPCLEYPTLWCVGETAVVRFETGHAAKRAYDKLNGPFVFKMGDKEVTVNKEDIALIDEEQHNQS